MLLSYCILADRSANERVSGLAPDLQFKRTSRAKIDSRTLMKQVFE